MSSAKTFDFVTAVVDRAQRRTAASASINAVSALQFPNGERRRMAFPGLKFGEMGANFGKRDQYGDMKFTANGSTFRKL
jgi:hypothetical protein